jgi:hypothetical protein
MECQIMRSKLVPAILAVSLALGGAAFASTKSEGTIKAFDTANQTITLEDGTVYKLPTNFSEMGLHVGEKVSLVWDQTGEIRQATSVTVMK